LILFFCRLTGAPADGGAKERPEALAALVSTARFHPFRRIRTLAGRPPRTLLSNADCLSDYRFTRHQCPVGLIHRPSLSAGPRRCMLARRSSLSGTAQFMGGARSVHPAWWNRAPLQLAPDDVTEPIKTKDNASPRKRASRQSPPSFRGVILQPSGDAALHAQDVGYKYLQGS
jgi:hypothetical protein